MIYNSVILNSKADHESKALKPLPPPQVEPGSPNTGNVAGEGEEGLGFFLNLHSLLSEGSVIKGVTGAY